MFPNMIQKTRLFFSCFLVPLFLHASVVQVLESEDIMAIDEYVQENTLVVLDLDDTLFRSNTTLGNPACYYGLRDFFNKKKTHSEKEIRQAFCSFDTLLQKHLEFTLVDERIKDLIEKCNKEDISVVGLTSRTPQLAEVTHKILQNLGIQLGKNVPLDRKRFTLQAESLYDRGVLYVGDGNAKSAVLDYFIQNLCPHNKPLTQIVFADDKEMYVRDLEKYSQTKGYDYFGLYYVKEKKRQRGIDLALAREQIKHLVVYSRTPLELTDKIEDPVLLHLFFGEVPNEGEFFLVGNVVPDLLIQNQSE